ncbi:MULTISPECIES: hypothetical protein [unclassified Pseudoalteromonas]|uniref:hypothetical protein n=1 Tax=unclassified Pseudoalteromonas TaxID=194690 RepID=UPI0019D04C7F|nr:MULTISPECIES: hypothetical protein [unclassified Pseudoalteromonas]MBR8841293.1 hypothetical protein [Pseudoalteromonas sp. JC3]QUI71127.1 hypothetical protein GSF13_15815 [Pseudoalteromonas sp. M8]WJE07321.1 hypothetical protein QSH61_10410 [Pseudoalteromonas sp. JC3]
MNKTKLELIAIAEAGASLILDSSKFTKLELVAIAKAITERRNLTLENCQSKTKIELIAIAQAASGKVTFQ